VMPRWDCGYTRRNYRSVAGTFGRCACESRLLGRGCSLPLINIRNGIHSSTEKVSSGSQTPPPSQRCRDAFPGTLGREPLPAPCETVICAADRRSHPRRSLRWSRMGLGAKVDCFRVADDTDGRAGTLPTTPYLASLYDTAASRSAVSISRERGTGLTQALQILAFIQACPVSCGSLKFAGFQIRSEPRTFS
jgi:hypothetical protein